MVFDIWGKVFVMRLGALEVWVVWVWLRVIPIQLFVPLPHFVPILIDDRR